LAPAVPARNPLLYNLKPPIYSAPFYELSMLPLEQNSEAGATTVAVPPSVVTRHPVAAVGLTIALAFLVSIGIFAYASTTRAGDLVYDWGQKMWSGSNSHSIPRDLAPPVSRAPVSSKTSQK
jgi:hypothetical protein